MLGTLPAVGGIETLRESIGLKNSQLLVDASKEQEQLKRTLSEVLPILTSADENSIVQAAERHRDEAAGGFEASSVRYQSTKESLRELHSHMGVW